MRFASSKNSAVVYLFYLFYLSKNEYTKPALLLTNSMKLDTIKPKLDPSYARILLIRVLVALSAPYLEYFRSIRPNADIVSRAFS